MGVRGRVTSFFAELPYLPLNPEYRVIVASLITTPLFHVSSP